MSGAQSTGVRWETEIILNEVKNLDTVNQGLSNWLDSVPQGAFAIQSHFFFIIITMEKVTIRN